MNKYIPPIQSNRTRARLEILNYVLNFSTMVYFGDESYRRSKECAFRSHILSAAPEVGALCVLTSAPNTKWYLSWLKEVHPASFPTYVMESIEDGELCNWTNVGFLSLPLELTDKFPSWKWIDDQFEFRERVYKAFQRADCHMAIPINPVFSPDGSVVVTTRERWMTSDRSVSKTFINYKKVRLKDLIAFAKQAEVFHKKLKDNE